MRLAARDLASPGRTENGELLLITRHLNFADFTAIAFDQIRLNAENNFAILVRQLQSLEFIGAGTCNKRRKVVLQQQTQLIGSAAKRVTGSKRDEAEIAYLLARVSKILKT